MSCIRISGSSGELDAQKIDSMEILRNGTLIIPNANNKYAGKYACVASNGFDSVTSRYASVTVNGEIFHTLI